MSQTTSQGMRSSEDGDATLNLGRPFGTFHEPGAVLKFSSFVGAIASFPWKETGRVLLAP